MAQLICTFSSLPSCFKYMYNVTLQPLVAYWRLSSNHLAPNACCPHLRAIGPTTGNFIAIAKWQIMPPHWCPSSDSTTAAQQPESAALCKASSSASANRLDTFCNALDDVFAPKALAHCSSEGVECRHTLRSQHEVLNEDVFVYSKTVRNKVVAMGLGGGGT
jgi:hypothetical protein